MNDYEFMMLWECGEPTEEECMEELQVS